MHTNFNTIRPQQPQFNKKPENFCGAKTENKQNSAKGIGKKSLIGIASAAITAIWTGTILAKKNNDIDIEKAQKFFDNTIKQTVGNNKVICESIQKENAEVQKFIEKYPKGYEEIKKSIKDMLDIRNAGEFIKDNTLFHGTNLSDAKDIMKNGVSPFARRCGAIMGYGLHTTSSEETAVNHTMGSFVLPFKFEGKIGKLKGEAANDPNTLRLEIMDQISLVIDPPPKNKNKHNFMPSREAEKYAKAHTNGVLIRALQDLGVGGVMCDIFVMENGSMRRLKDVGRITVIDGTKLTLDVEKLKQINPINEENYKDFL